MAFEPQNDLERSLVKAATEPEHRPQFYKDLAQSDIFIIQHGVPPPQSERRLILEKDTSIQIQNIEYDGKPYIPIFSSQLRLREALTKEATYLQMNTLAFLELTKGAALLLNPGSEYGKEITAVEAASIVDGSIWRPDNRYVVQKETQVLIGQPQKYPSHLVEWAHTIL